MDIRQKIDKLKQQIRHHDYLYYVVAQKKLWDNNGY